ncbi:MAG: UDP-N-acetylmuramoyl-L-alanyl-D-glutamate--2,6-diaminopimelate ligase [Planctomycetota bacterium]
MLASDARATSWQSLIIMKTLGRPLRLARIRDLLDEAQLIGDPELEVQALAADSRSVHPGSLFFAVRGTQLNGASYLQDAIARGASALVVEELAVPLDVPVLLVKDCRMAKASVARAFYRQPSRDLDVFGVTGTNGKTTTTFMLKAILDCDDKAAGLLGTVGNDTGGGLQRSSNTTPDPIELNRLLAEMVDRNLRSAAIEVSSHALMQQRVAGIDFRVGLFTNLTPEHLDYHGTMAEYARAKAMLFEMLAPSAHAVLNLGDPWAPFMRERTRAQVVTFGTRDDADVHARVRRMDIDGMAFDVISPWGRFDVTSRFMGRHNLENALGAAAAALCTGVDPLAVKAGFETLTRVPGRLDPVDRGQDFRVLIDYAHTDDALRQVLANLRPLTRGRLIAVFGCGGDRDRAKRPRMGRVAADIADLAVITSDNPRSEDPQAIIADVLAGVPAGTRCVVEADRRAAIEVALRTARGGDIVLIAGKGHEDYQIVRDQKIRFDDRAVADEILWQLSASTRS